MTALRWALAPLSLLMVLNVLGTGCEEDGVSTFVPQARFAASAVDFGDVSLGASATASLTVINDGNAPLELLSLPTASTAEFEVLDASGFPLQGGAFTAITLRFTPVEEGPTEAQLRLPFASPLSTTTVPLRGVGIEPPISLSPAAIDFGSIDAGDRAPSVVTITNESEDALSIDLALTNSVFAIGDGLQDEVSLAAGESKEITIEFRPPGAGNFVGELIAEVCGPQCGPSVSLGGEGRAPRISVTPRPADFGAVSVGDVGQLSLALENVGIGTLVVSRMSLEDGLGAMRIASAFAVDALPLELSAGDRVDIPLEYAPTAPNGDYRGTLVIDSSDPLSPRVAIPITATTPGAALRVLPSALHFGRLDPGEERTLDVVLLSSGTDAVSVEAIDLLGDGNAADAFEIDGFLPSFPVVLAPHESLLLSLRAEARDVDAENGGAFAELSVATGETVHAVPMTFNAGDSGCQPRALPSNLSFGNLQVGQGASGRIEIVNDGDGVCTLTRAAPAAGLAFDAGFVFQTLGLDVLEPQDAGAVQFAFQASTDGPATAVLAIEFEEQPAPLLLSASARGVSGALVAVPPSVTLGPTTEGCAQAGAVVSFVNDGAAEVTITGTHLDPPLPEIATTSTFGSRTVLPGAAFDQGVGAVASAQAGHYVTQLVAETEEVGPVRARIELIVEPTGAPISEQFVAADAASNEVDILFVIDNSGSMGDDQQILADNFHRFIESAFLTSPDIDVRIGVTTTDILLPTAADGRFVGQPGILRSGSPTLAQDFQQRALVGTDGAGWEHGLEAMLRALDGRNGGFPRRNAALSVVIVSDEDDGGTDGSAVPRSTDSYIQHLNALKAGSFSGASVLVNLVVRPDFSPRYTAVADAFDGVVLDISSQTWGENLGVIGAATVGLVRLLRLENRPVSSSVVVTIDGVATTAFTVDEGAQAVVLDSDPPPGAEIIVEYVVQCG